MESIHNSSIHPSIINNLPLSQGATLKTIWTSIHEQYPHIPAFSTEEQMRAWLATPMSNLALIHVKKLDLSNLELTELSPELGRFTNLRELDLSFNSLTALPDSIANLSQLQVLKLKDNLFQVLPQAISHLGQFNQLIELDIEENNLGEVPAWINQLQSLDRLYLSNNLLQTLPITIGDLPNLAALTVDHNQLNELPASMENLDQLETLFIDHNPLLQALPEELYNLPLSELIIDRHLYDAIPSEAPIINAYECDIIENDGEDLAQPLAMNEEVFSEQELSEAGSMDSDAEMSMGEDGFESSGAEEMNW